MNSKVLANRAAIARSVYMAIYWTDVTGKLAAARPGWFGEFPSLGTVLLFLKASFGLRTSSNDLTGDLAGENESDLTDNANAMKF